MRPGNRWNLLAEAERVCADIRYGTPRAQADLRYARKSVFDFHGSRLYTDAATLAGEDVIMAARNDVGGPAVRDAVAMDSLAHYKHCGSFELHNNQRVAAA